MARIRTIKPEFPQSESMGRISRDARLLFIMLWTICDDEGNTRANSRMLASLLYPYDDDVPSLIGGWLDELENEKCIIRFEVDGQHYLSIVNWLIHQRIDRPSKSKFPSLANNREDSRGFHVGSEDQGSKDQRIKDRGSRAHAPDPAPQKNLPAESNQTFTNKPSSARSRDSPLPDDFYPNKTGQDYALQAGLNLAAQVKAFKNHHTAKGTLFSNWQAAWCSWCDKAVEFGKKGNQSQTVQEARLAWVKEVMGDSGGSIGRQNQIIDITPTDAG